jgi:hypothetical protein
VATTLGGDDPARLADLERIPLSAEERLTAEDLGIDRLGARLARHCRLVIDGRSAVAGFVVLRWLVGEDERTITPGAGLGAWRGALDYWVRPADAGVGDRLVRAAVAIDGQPPGWPFSGLHASLGAALDVGERSSGRDVRPVTPTRWWPAAWSSRRRRRG